MKPELIMTLKFYKLYKNLVVGVTKLFDNNYLRE